jgi:predicted transcriptional regulator
MTHTRPTYAVVVVVLVAQAGVVAAAAPGLSGTGADEPLVVNHTDRSGSDAGRLAVVDVARPAGTLALAGYRRHDGSDPLAHEKRRRLHRAVERNPGGSLAAAARESGVAISTARYHLRVLESEGLVETEKIRGRKCLYAGGFDGDRQLAAALREDALAAVLVAVERHHPASVSALASDLERSPGTVSHHVGRLADAGLLSCEREGRTKRVALTAIARAGL